MKKLRNERIEVVLLHKLKYISVNHFLLKNPSRIFPSTFSFFYFSLFTFLSIKRGDKEIIPRGSVKLISGDYIVVLVNIDKRASVIEEINGLTLV